MWHQPEEMAQDLKLSGKSTPKTTPVTAVTTSSPPDSSPRMALLSMLVYQAYLTLGKKMPEGAEAKLFNDGWYSALKDVPTESLKDAFSDAIASGKPFIPGLVVQSYREKIGAQREEIKRKPQDEGERPFPFHAKLREAGTERVYSFALLEPPLCRDCGRPAEVFRYVGPRKAKMFFCSFHGEMPPVATFARQEEEFPF